MSGDPNDGRPDDGPSLHYGIEGSKGAQNGKIRQSLEQRMQVFLIWHDQKRIQVSYGNSYNDNRLGSQSLTCLGIRQFLLGPRTKDECEHKHIYGTTFNNRQKFISERVHITQTRQQLFR